MHCTEQPGTAGLRCALRSAWVVVVALVSGCAQLAAPAPAPRPAPAAPAPALAPAPTRARAPAVTAPAPSPPVAAAPAAPQPQAATGAVNLGPKVALPPASVARNWEEFRRQAARRMVAASPQGSYMGQPPPMLFGIPIMEVELNHDGSVRQIRVTRAPANELASDTIDYAIEAIRRGAPYGDVTRLAKPWKWTEVFLFNDKRQFKPRILD